MPAGAVEISILPIVFTGEVGQVSKVGVPLM